VRKRDDGRRRGRSRRKTRLTEICASVNGQAKLLDPSKVGEMLIWTHQQVKERRSGQRKIAEEAERERRRVRTDPEDGELRVDLVVDLDISLVSCHQESTSVYDCKTGGRGSQVETRELSQGEKKKDELSVMMTLFLSREVV